MPDFIRVAREAGVGWGESLQLKCTENILFITKSYEIDIEELFTKALFDAAIKNIRNIVSTVSKKRDFEVTEKIIQETKNQAKLNDDDPYCLETNLHFHCLQVLFRRFQLGQQVPHCRLQHRCISRARI